MDQKLCRIRSRNSLKLSQTKTLLVSSCCHKHFKLYEDDIGPVVDGGRIPANGTSLSGAAEACVASHEIRKAAMVARAIVAIKEKLGEDGVNSRE